IGARVAFVDFGCHGLTDRLRALEGDVALQGESEIDEEIRTALARPYTLDAQDIGDLCSELADAIGCPVWGRVEQRPGAAVAEARADVDADRRHEQGG